VKAERARAREQNREDKHRRDEETMADIEDPFRKDKDKDPWDEKDPVKDPVKDPIKDKDKDKDKDPEPTPEPIGEVNTNPVQWADRFNIDEIKRRISEKRKKSLGGTLHTESQRGVKGKANGKGKAVATGGEAKGKGGPKAAEKPTNAAKKSANVSAQVKKRILGVSKR